MQPNPELCPPHIREALDEYAELRRPVGHFLTAVLANDLENAIGRADSKNLEALPHILAYAYNCLPHACWGSLTKVYAWLEGAEDKA